MIFVFCALYQEASNFISHFHLKRDSKESMFQVFRGGGIILAITGVGKNAASVCVSRILTQERPDGRLESGDLILSFGCAGGLGFAKGEILQVNRIMDSDSRRWSYPDLSIVTDFPQAPLISSGVPVCLDASEEASEGFLYDMEGSALYGAAAYFGGPHQILMFKMVSDALSPDSIDAKGLAALMDANLPPLLEWMEGLIQEESVCDDPVNGLEEQLVRDFHLSAYQSYELHNLLHYCTLSGMDPSPVLQELYDSEALPASDKRKGTKVFEQFKSNLLTSVR